MNTNLFNFELPAELIAQYPAEERSKSRLMVIDRKNRSREHRMVRELPSILEPGTVMVFNNSRVRKARLFGFSETTGARTEFLLLKKTDIFSWQVLTNRAKSRKPGKRFIFDDVSAEIKEKTGETMILHFDSPIDDAWLDLHGHVPLPPYIKRPDTLYDGERYQTVYAREHGSAAAPTAGLHFSNELLVNLARAGIETVYITLHVGLGTFLPVRTETVEEHIMHEETYTIDESAASRIEKAKTEGRKVLAVGTTSVRTLESAWVDEGGAGKLRRGEGRTSIFIYPGYKFKAVDAIFTNFHTPESTLLMLVSAFAGRELILECYKEAVKEAYRFFSYGDACLIL